MMPSRSLASLQVDQSPARCLNLSALPPHWTLPLRACCAGASTAQLSCGSECAARIHNCLHCPPDTAAGANMQAVTCAAASLQPATPRPQQVAPARPGQQQQAAPRSKCTCAAAAAASAASAAATCPPARLASASLSSREQQLSAAEQARIVGMGAAIRALQKVRLRAGRKPGADGRGRWPALFGRSDASRRPLAAAARCPACLQDLPALLDQAPSLDVYSESVVFEDRLSPRLGLPSASCGGREAYGRLCWSLRFHRMLFFRHAKVRCARACPSLLACTCVCVSLCFLPAHCTTGCLFHLHANAPPLMAGPLPSACLCAPAQVELQRMWEREPGVVCVRWSARAAPRLGDLVAPTAAHMTLDGVSGEPCRALLCSLHAAVPRRAQGSPVALRFFRNCPPTLLLARCLCPPAPPASPAEFQFDDAGLISRHELDCVAYSGMQLQASSLCALCMPRGRTGPCPSCTLHLAPACAGRTDRSVPGSDLCPPLLRSVLHRASPCSPAWHASSERWCPAWRAAPGTRRRQWTTADAVTFALALIPLLHIRGPAPCRPLSPPLPFIYNATTPFDASPVCYRLHFVRRPKSRQPCLHADPHSSALGCLDCSKKQCAHANTRDSQPISARCSTRGESNGSDGGNAASVWALLAWSADCGPPPPPLSTHRAL